LQEALIGATKRMAPQGFYRRYRGFWVLRHPSPVVVTTGISSAAPIGAFNRIQVYSIEMK